MYKYIIIFQSESTFLMGAVSFYTFKKRDIEWKKPRTSDKYYIYIYITSILYLHQ